MTYNVFGVTLNLAQSILLRQLEEEIEKMLLMDGLRRKDHVLELNRLMLRAESVEHRLSLLKIIQVTASAFVFTWPLFEAYRR